MTPTAVTVRMGPPVPEPTSIALARAAQVWGMAALVAEGQPTRIYVDDKP